jgi:diacylglycerol kinase
MANMILPPPHDMRSAERQSDRQPCRRWRDKFREALRGVKLGVRGHSSFFAHFFVTALVIAAAVVLQCALIEWCVLIGCVGSVLTAELFNSALETLFHGLDPMAKQRMHGVLDIAAGAVLLMSATAAVIGGSLLGYRLMVFLGWL